MNSDEDTMRDEYDFSGGVRGKYVDRLREGSNVVLISPDLAEKFPTEAAVDAALRELLRIREQQAESNSG
jgi:hypothetical protein